MEEALEKLGALAPTLTCDRKAAAAWDPDAIGQRLSGAEFKEYKDALSSVEMCNKAVKEEPQNRRLWFQLGRSFDGAQQFDKAKAAYDTAARLGSSSALVNIGVLYAQGSIGAVADRHKARDYYRRAAVQENSEGMYQYATSLAFDDKAGALDRNEAKMWFKRALDKRMVNPTRAEEALRRLQ
jgi:TPR repeat protein